MELLLIELILDHLRSAAALVKSLHIYEFPSDRSHHVKNWCIMAVLKLMKILTVVTHNKNIGSTSNFARP